MIDIRTIIKTLQTSDVISEEVAIAKGKYNLPMNYKEFKQYLKLRKNGN
tara:strand:+ start:450 stop:596 length:147 start_codon:yes stop_codon:yes gene_type:complete